MQCPDWDCFERNDLGCCQHTACINPKYNINGHWGVISVGTNFNTNRLCSHCKKEIKSNYWNYCPNCGAKMDEVSE